MLKQEIKEKLKSVLKDLGVATDHIMVDYPVDAKHGDYASNVALIAAKKAGKNPRELAEAITVKIKESGMFEKVEVAGPGFINFWVKEEELINEISENVIQQIGKGKKVIVEYSSPNIAKPFTIGHLRSTIIGDAIANIMEAVGYTVFRDNHLGDWGTQFGKQIYAIKTWGNEEELDKSDRPVKVLVDLYVKFHNEAEKNPQLEDLAREWFKKLEDGDSEARRLWEKCIEWSWREFDEIYKQLQVSFTENGGRGYGEAFFEDKMDIVVDELQEKQLLKEGKEGAKIVVFPEETKLPTLMIIKKDGATLYATRDLATDRFRLFEHEVYGRDVLIINEVGAEQALYFQQLYKVEEMLGWVTPGQRVHVKHGLYRFKEGKMSTRKGNVILLEDVLTEAVTRAQKLSKDKDIAIAKQVAMGALKWNDLKRDSKQDISFDWDEILNMQGNSGPYIQYTYARTQSVLTKAKSEKRKAKKLAEGVRLQTEERDVLRLITRFPEVVEEAATRYSPHVLCTFLFDLAQAFNLFYQKYRILKAEDAERDLRLDLTAKTGDVLKQGLNLLGITSPERM